MGKREQAIRLWKKKQAEKQERIQRNTGMLGNGSGVVRVPKRTDFVYFRPHGNPKILQHIMSD